MNQSLIPSSAGSCHRHPEAQPSCCPREVCQGDQGGYREDVMWVDAEHVSMLFVLLRGQVSMLFFGEP